MRVDDSNSPPRWAIAWFVALVALTITVRVVHPTGWLGSDDAAYYSAAEHVLTGEPIQRVHHQYARAPVVLAVAASVALFGHNAEAVALPMLVASVLCVVLVAVLGAMLLGWWEGLFAGTVVAVLPYFRVLSTTAYPDVHVCLWSTAAMLLAVVGVRGRPMRIGSLPLPALIGFQRRTVIWLACGFAAGLAISAKVFAVAVLPAIAWVAARRAVPLVGGAVGESTPPTRGGATLRRLIAVAAGLATFQLLEGLFHLWIAGDFFFSLRAMLAAQAVVPELATESGAASMTLIQFVTDRLAMLLHSSTSGWGSIGVLFWPALGIAAVWKREARALVVWALATFVLIAFVPLNLKSGAQPYPIFHGRHILPACVPFALCLGWIVRRAGERVTTPRWVTRSWPVAATCVVALAYSRGTGLNGFRDRATSRVGEAIRQCVVESSWDDRADVFMSPSMYWRFRILFPEPLRGRLRVAVDDSAPEWWKKVCPDITRRVRSLPPPGEAYLLATPVELRGECELWEYGVALPADRLAAWRSAPALATLVRGADKRICFATAAVSGESTVLLLVGPHAPDPRIAGVAPPPSEPSAIVR